MDNKKIAVVTGGSRGIGKEIAVKLAEEAYVIVNYNGSEEKAAQVVREIKDKGGNAEAVKCNVASFKECEKFIGDIVERFGKIDILVNNAGINKDGLILSMSEEDFDSVINTNLKGTFNCIKFVSKSMIKNRYGKIINISSISGVAGNPGQANYAASKAGIIGLTKSVAKELAKRNINVNAIAPGFIMTEMTDVLRDEVKENILSQIPLKRFGTPRDVAEVAAFLASDKSSYITGQVINLDGGMIM